MNSLWFNLQCNSLGRICLWWVDYLKIRPTYSSILWVNGLWEHFEIFSHGSKRIGQDLNRYIYGVYLAHCGPSASDCCENTLRGIYNNSEQLSIVGCMGKAIGDALGDGCPGWWMPWVGRNHRPRKLVSLLRKCYLAANMGIEHLKTT